MGYTARRSTRGCKKTRRIASGVMLLALAGCWRGGKVEHRDEGRLGKVALYAPGAEPRGVVFLFSDGSGWNDALDGEARALAAAGAAVVGVDPPA